MPGSAARRAVKLLSKNPVLARSVVELLMERVKTPPPQFRKASSTVITIPVRGKSCQDKVSPIALTLAGQIPSVVLGSISPELTAIVNIPVTPHAARKLSKPFILAYPFQP